MQNSKWELVASILVIAIGIGWLLNTLDILPTIDWLWTIAIAIIGTLSIVFGGVNKLSMVVGPFLIFASVCSILRQTKILPLDVEIPLLILVLGCLLFVARILNLPAPKCMQEEEEE